MPHAAVRLAASSTVGLAVLMAAPAWAISADGPRVATGAVPVAQPSSVAVRGAPEPARAPVIRPGRYTDLIPPGSVRWYAFDVVADVVPSFSAAVAGVPAAAPQGTPCAVWRAKLVTPELTSADGSLSSATAFTGLAASKVAVSASAAQVAVRGRWYVEVALADEVPQGVENCSGQLPSRAYQAALELTTAPRSAAVSSSMPTVAASPGAAGVPSPLPPAVEKYFVEPEPATPAWVYPSVAVLLFVGVGGTVLGIRQYRRSHYL